MALHQAGVTGSSSLLPQSKTDAGHGVYDPLLSAVVAELAPQPMHRHAHDFTGRPVVEAPYVSRDRGRRHHCAALAHQEVQKPELSARQAGRDAVTLQRALDRIETERAHFEGGPQVVGPLAVRAARMGPDAREDLAVSEGLDHVVVGA